MEKSDEITEWLANRGRTALNLEAARQLAAESPQQWYVAAQGTRGYLIGKMTLQKYSARHILVDDAGQPLLFPTVEAAMAFLRAELKVDRPHVFSY
jgi:hypothetical protein